MTKTKFSISELNAMLRGMQILVRDKRRMDIPALKTEIRKMQSRIANRERYDAMRSLGLVKTPYGWE
jgi:hypothetical protein